VASRDLEALMTQTLWTNTADDILEPSTKALSPESSSTSPAAREALFQRFRSRIVHNPALDRSIVSYQANKGIPFSGWFKYREGFAEELVRYLLGTLHPQPGALLDPFAGSGSALFAARDLGWRASGIEVLPVGLYAMQARLAATSVDRVAFQAAIEDAVSCDFERQYDVSRAFKHIPITRGAFPESEERSLIGYLVFCETSIADEAVRGLMQYAAFCVLEDISYTRKDGQYLRWDARSGRSQGKRPFNKGRILTFHEAISGKLRQMAHDLGLAPIQTTLFAEAPVAKNHQELRLLNDSCLTLMPEMMSDTFDFILTSPPYANRYDYTRTYALELLYLGCDDAQVKRLRQTMLSCTVENRDKRAQLCETYATLNRSSDFDHVDGVFHGQAALQEALTILEVYRKQGRLNNDNISRLVRNYFYEMCFVVAEFARVLKPGGVVAMVNDNVRYAGEEIPVDLILSDFAESFGLSVRHIWTLGRGKGNSSQQMGYHGRTELRKCVYVWEKV
jgi:DNA modification methylase